MNIGKYPVQKLNVNFKPQLSTIIEVDGEDVEWAIIGEVTAIYDEDRIGYRKSLFQVLKHSNPTDAIYRFFITRYSKYGMIQEMQMFNSEDAAFEAAPWAEILRTWRY